MSDFMVFLGEYKNVFLILFEVLIMVILGVVLYVLYQSLKAHFEKQNSLENSIRIGSEFTGEVGETIRQNAIREMIAMDGVNPAPNHYLAISEGGREYYVRCVTISVLPKNVRYAETLKPLFMFPNCTSTVFVKPVSSEEISHKIDHQINILEAEQYTNAGNTNRVRKLGTQIDDAVRQADKVERDGVHFYKAGFLFVFAAESVEKLNRMTDDFRAVALNKKMDISNCYGSQSEAYISSMPLNRHAGTLIKNMGSDCVKMFLLDQGALSVILNYTTDHFTHKRGIPLGRNLFNGQPTLFDFYDPSHDGYSVVIAGKTHSGKSATIKAIIERFVPLGYRFVIIDSQERKGTSEGEYASVTEINGGVNYQISSNNKNIINLFDVQESIEFVRESSDSGYERRTLDLNGAITDMLSNVRSLMQRNASDDDVQMDLVLDSDINAILQDVIKEMFAERGIVHGVADSLYEEGQLVEGGMLQSGLVPKKLPTIGECYQKVLVRQKNNRVAATEGAYRFIVNNLKENVKELYYIEDKAFFFTKEQYQQLENVPGVQNQKYYVMPDGERVIVKAHFGIRPYFDGQSTVRLSRDCPVTTIDISQLTEKEKKAAREIATTFMNEHFIKKNSERLDSADKIVGIIDEAHEEFEYLYGRKTCASISRTARKRHAGMIYATQTVKEFMQYEDTEVIFKQAAAKMIFKQDAQDSEVLKKALNITDSQVAIITKALGVAGDMDDESNGNSHRGEMCLVDGEQCQFLKVDLRNSERLAVETDASQVIKIRKASEKKQHTA